MSTDERVTEDLITTLRDGQYGFAQAAERLRDTNRSDLCARFTAFSTQRAKFAEELRALAGIYGDSVDDSGSLAGTVHRGWMSVKDAVAGPGDPEGVLDAAEQGEDHAVSMYKKALDEDISPELRSLIERQSAEVRAAHDEVRAARDVATK